MKSRFWIAGLLILCQLASVEAKRERILLNEDWSFHLGDIVADIPISHHETYLSSKAGNALGAANPIYDDSEWRVLKLPHDWAVEGPFSPYENVSEGYRQRGIGWYRRHFELAQSDRGRYLELQFDGVASHCQVWVNGTLVHRNFNGYSSFQIDISSLAKFGEGELNTIAVRVDASVIEGWWYEGAGIYRHTWLEKRDPVHIVTDGVYANPVHEEGDNWTIPAEVSLHNISESPVECELLTTVIDPEERIVAEQRLSTVVAVFETKVVAYPLEVVQPQLWDLENPTLYRVVTKVFKEGTEVDRVETKCGFRTIRFDANEGFFLNGKAIKIKGVCNHQDHAGVGVAVPDALWEFRLQRLKEMGANAYRCSHHPASAEFMDACDRMGILVMGENRHFNVSPEYLGQLEWMVRRDRNRPSVILWSVFNEEPVQGTRIGYEMVRRLTAKVKELDSTRPITAAMSDGFFTPLNVSGAVDVMGFNYNQKEYDKFHDLHPDLPLISSEETSGFMVRGEYESDSDRNIIAAYDTDAAYWGATHAESWRLINERPFIAGGFVWTGFDYHGEPQPHTWPSVLSVFGCMDVCGFPKTAYYIRQAQWINDRPVLEIVPHWNWEGREGKLIKVVAATNGDRAELFLNGVSQGTKSVDPYEMVQWEVSYEPGTIEVVVEKNGSEYARKLVKTTGPAVALELIPYRKDLIANGMDAMPITVRALDQNGLPVPTANMRVEFVLEGNGEIIGLGNGDPNSHEPEKGNRRSLYNGLAQVIVQSVLPEPGAPSKPIKLRAISPGLHPAEIEM